MGPAIVISTDQSQTFQFPKTTREKRSGQPGRTISQLRVSRWTVEEVANDDRRPPLGKDFGGSGNRAVLAVCLDGASSWKPNLNLVQFLSWIVLCGQTTIRRGPTRKAA